MSTSLVSQSRTSPVATPTATWHVGSSPAFPSSLTLSSDTAIESLLTDIPFLSVGLLGFGVITFFFAMRKSNQLTFYVFASVIVAFVAGVLDVSQILARGERTPNNNADDTSSILPLLVARELALAVSIGIRFLFFWIFVSTPPRGETLYTRTSQKQGPTFFRIESQVHGGSWARWGAPGFLFKYILLLATIAIPVLQFIWRFVAQFNRSGPAYNADGALQIAVSSLFILKLFVNTWVSSLRPRWKTLRDYSPVIVALLISAGVGIGNILCFQFSETSLGRLFQAVELYILVLYVLISTFYHQRSRMSIIADPETLRGMDLTPPENLREARSSNFPSKFPTQEPMGQPLSGTAAPTSRPSNKRLSSSAEHANEPPQLSTAEKLTAWLMSRRIPGKRDRERSRLWNKEDMEAGMSSPVDEKAGYAASLDASPLEPRETTPWSVEPFVRESPKTVAVEAPSIFKGNDAFLSSTASSPDVERNVSPSSKQIRRPGSPVYGLGGIMEYNDKKSRPISTQASGMDSLLRMQAELDKSVAELQALSSRRMSATSGGMISTPGGESFRSEFSLSNFPEPPPKEVGVSFTKEASDPMPKTGTTDDMSSTPRPPRVRVVSANVTQQSLPSVMRRSSDSDMAETDVTRRAVLGSGGTLYDVTSFISDLTTPPLKGPNSQGEKLIPVVEQPALEKALTVTSVKSAPLRTDPTASLNKSSSQAEKLSSPIEQGSSESTATFMVTESAPQLAVRMQAPLPVLIATEQAAPPSSKLPGGLRRIRQGLPPRSRLNISGPIPRVNVEKSTAYERPRPVPAP